jgi:peptidoglycan/xylan/chitin deacetylase (PgdA/CDA1 family)
MASDSLVTIGAHGTQHRILTDCTSAEKKEEIIDSKHKIEKIMGKKCNLFAYSHGQCDEECFQILEKAGYKMGFIVGGKPVNRVTVTSQYQYPRMSVEEATKKLYV